MTTPQQSQPARKKKRAPRPKKARAQQQIVKEIIIKPKHVVPRKRPTRTTGVQLMPNRAPNRNVELIMSNLSMPGETPTVRWNDAYSTTFTALACPWQRTNMSPGMIGQGLIPPTDQLAMVFRDPLRSAIIYDANPTNQIQSYLLYFFISKIITPIPTVSPQYDPPDVNLNMIVSYLGANSAYRPHGDTLYCGDAENDEGTFFWMEQGSTLTFTLTVNAVSDVTFFMNWWYKGSVTLQAQTLTVITGSASGFLTTAESGYYSLSFTCGDPFTINAVEYNHSGSTFAHLALPDFSKNYQSTQAIRINALSLLYTNKASTLNREGNIIGFQAPSSSDWQDYAFFGSDAIDSAQGSVSIDAQKGMFGYMKPASAEDFNFQSPYSISNGIMFRSGFPLQPKSEFLILYSSMSTAGQDGYYTRTYAIEYQTTDVWRDIASPSIPIRDWEVAVQNLKGATQYHENPLHVADLWRAIKNSVGTVARGIGRYGPQALSIAKMFA